MIEIELSPAGVEKFNTFLDKYAPQYDKQIAAYEMIDVITDSYIRGESLSYEVRAFDSATKRPEIFYLSDADVIVTQIPEE